MSTRCSIGIFRDSGAVNSIYCHWDGYPTYVGKLLQEHYQNPAKLESLIAHGDLSSLAPNIGTYNTFLPEKSNPNVCLFYARDRGETGCAPRRYPSRGRFLQAAKQSWAEYAYLYCSGPWFVKNLVHSFSSRWIPL